MITRTIIAMKWPGSPALSSIITEEFWKHFFYTCSFSKSDCCNDSTESSFCSKDRRISSMSSRSLEKNIKITIFGRQMIKPHWLLQRHFALKHTCRQSPQISFNWRDIISTCFQLYENHIDLVSKVLESNAFSLKSNVDSSKSDLWITSHAN